MLSPTEKQIKFVETICNVLNIANFPSSSKEYSRKCFSSFISSHIDEFSKTRADINEDVDFIYEYVGCENDVWCEYY